MPTVNEDPVERSYRGYIDDIPQAQRSNVVEFYREAVDEELYGISPSLLGKILNDPEKLESSEFRLENDITPSSVRDTLKQLAKRKENAVESSPSWSSDILYEDIQGIADPLSKQDEFAHFVANYTNGDVMAQVPLTENNARARLEQMMVRQWNAEIAEEAGFTPIARPDILLTAIDDEPYAVGVMEYQEGLLQGPDVEDESVRDRMVQEGHRLQEHIRGERNPWFISSQTNDYVRDGRLTDNLSYHPETDTVVIGDLGEIPAERPYDSDDVYSSDETPWESRQEILNHTGIDDRIEQLDYSVLESNSGLPDFPV